MSQTSPFPSGSGRSEQFEPPSGGTPPQPVGGRAGSQEEWGSFWQGPPGSGPAVEIVAGPVPPLRKGRRRALVVVAAMLVAAVAGGGAYTWSALNARGDQPEHHLPAGTAVMVKIDLNPTAEQKLQALRFAAKLPATRDIAGYAGDGDLRRAMYEGLSDEVGASWPNWSQVKPWLGDRAAVAVVPQQNADPITVVALQVTDQQDAKRTLSEIHGPDGSSTGVAVGDGWAYVSDSDADAAAVLAQARTKALDTDPTFTADVARVGRAGIAAAWYDAGRLTAALDKLSGEGGAAVSAAGPLGPISVLGPLGGLTPLGGLNPRGGLGAMSGHGAYLLRFTGADLELAGWSEGADTFRPHSGTSVQQLPADSVAAIGVSDAGSWAARQWQAMQQVLAAGGPTAQEGTSAGPGFATTTGSSVGVPGPAMSARQLASRLQAAGIGAKTAGKLAAKVKAGEARGGIPASVAAQIADQMHADGIPAAEMVRQLTELATPPADLSGAGGAVQGFGSAMGPLPGLKLPGDLQALFGTSFALAVALPVTDGVPALGVHVASVSPRLGPALSAVVKAADEQGLRLQRRDVAGGYVLATTSAQADALARGGNLGSTDRFRRAVPDATGAFEVVFVDLTRLSQLAGPDLNADDARMLASFGALGVSLTADARGGTSLRIRVTTR